MLAKLISALATAFLLLATWQECAAQVALPDAEKFQGTWLLVRLEGGEFKAENELPKEKRGCELKFEGTGKQVHAFEGVLGAVFSPDGRFLLSGGPGTTVRVWRVWSCFTARRFLATGCGREILMNIFWRTKEVIVQKFERRVVLVAVWVTVAFLAGCRTERTVEPPGDPPQPRLRIDSPQTFDVQSLVGMREKEAIAIAKKYGWGWHCEQAPAGYSEPLPQTSRTEPKAIRDTMYRSPKVRLWVEDGKVIRAIPEYPD
jgi:hypothetical protein